MAQTEGVSDEAGRTPGAPPPPAADLATADAPLPHSERARLAGASSAMVSSVGRIERLDARAGSLVGFLARVYGRYSRHRGAVLSGGLAFFATLSLVPAVISLAALGSLFVDPTQLVSGIEDLLAGQPQILQTLQPVLDEVRQTPQATLGSLGVRGLVTMMLFVYAASRFVYVVRQVLDTAFELVPHPPSLVSRGVAIGITLLIQVLIAVLLVALGVLPRLLDQWAIGDEISSGIRALRLPIGLVVSYVILTALMRYGVGRRRLVGWANLGSVVGSLIIVGSSLGLSAYLSASATYATVIDMLGGVIILQIWLFVVAAAIVLAAEVEGVRLGLRRTYHPPADPRGYGRR